ncbi:Protein gamete expressed 2 [Apostasia shenzhenica]|uniref:Protein gamete expressed 2 n=1 Tax=Apostasia shenzhenica TaxID=1088818 RepID=A0A2I0A2L9_9ASPA|nr:Protein gamete expressed 2 [Apostasia shenzhenica]
MEVNDGLLSTTLPGHLIKAAEVKMASSSQWEPLQTYVTIENQFILKGKGLRFRGSIEDCNIAMQRLFYQGINNDAMLVIRVNDLGNFGCYLDCTNRMSLPLSAEATVDIIKRRPLNSPFAFSLRTEGGSIDDRKKDIREVGAVSFQNSTSSDRMSTHVALPKKHSNLRQSEESILSQTKFILFKVTNILCTFVGKREDGIDRSLP